MELYSAREIAAAAGVPVSVVEEWIAFRHPDASRPRRMFVQHDEAVRLGRMLVRQAAPAPSGGLFSSIADSRHGRHPLLPLAFSGPVHAGLAAILVFIAGFNLAPHAAAQRIEERPTELLRMIFVATPGPGGGGGGGGLEHKTPPPKAMREGTRKVSSPAPPRAEPKPEPPLDAEPLPVIVAPIIAAPADPRSRVGVLEETIAQGESQGPGTRGGAGSGAGSGLGSGDGSGIGPGSGGGTGGGPYRPGSGIAPPRLLREVRAEYSEDARRRGVAGDVVLEIVVRRDGSVGDVKILQGLGGGLNDRAIQAVRQWRFAPAQRQGSAVDVIVEVAVEFTLR